MGCEILDHAVISARYFFPRRAPVPGPGAVEVTAASGDTLGCYHDVLEGADRTVVHFHGNGEVVADNLALLPAFREMGASTFLAEYRGYGASTGVPALGGMLDDVAAVREAVGRPDDEVVVFGRSVGSIYAIEYAARFPEVAGLVIESGIADVHQRLEIRMDPEELGTDDAGLRAAVAARLDHQAKLGAYKGPTLFLHTEHDELVGVEHARQNHAWSASEDKRLVVFEAGGHNDILYWNQVEYLRAVGALVEGGRAS